MVVLVRAVINRARRKAFGVLEVRCPSRGWPGPESLVR